MKSHIYTAASAILALSCLPAFACGPFYYEPGEYCMYRVSDKYLDGSGFNSTFNYGSDENCILWQNQTSRAIPLSDIYKIVYKADVRWIECLRHHLGDSWSFSDGPNQFAEWLWHDEEAADFLLLAKQCEAVREKMNDPWYYPTKKQPEKQSLSGIIEEAKRHSTGRFADRYVLQALRSMFSLRRFDDCINYWNDRESVMSDNIIRRLALRYVAGAYYNIGEVASAKKLYAEAKDVESLLFCAGKGNTDSWDALYEYMPETPALRASVKRAMVDAEIYVRNVGQNQFRVVDEDVVSNLQEIRDFSLRVATEGRVGDPGLWYYNAAFANHLLGRNKEAARLATLAEKSAGSDDIKESVRVLKIYLDALDPYNTSYENRMLSHVQWLERKVVEHIDEAREETALYGRYYTKINYSYFYWNDMLRKVVHAGIVPTLEKAGRRAAAIAYSNMADNLIFNLVNQIDTSWCGHGMVTLAEYRTGCCFNGLDYSNQTFRLLDRMPVEDIIKYVGSLERPKTTQERYLNSKGYDDVAYFREIIGTRMIRQMRYAEAEQWLSKVPASFQNQLNTYREGYFRFDPFVPEKTLVRDISDYKFKFAREMASLEETINNTKDPERKALLMTRFATGVKNSVGYCWALSFYGLSCSDTDTGNGPTLFSSAQDKGFARAYELYRQALALSKDKETTAQINLLLGNHKTIVEKYSTTRAAISVRGHCDTYWDYHFEKKENYWQSNL